MPAHLDGNIAFVVLDHAKKWRRRLTGRCDQTFVITLRPDAIITTAHTKHVLQELLRRAELYLVSLGRTALRLRLDRVANRSRFMGARLSMLRERMDGGGMDERLK